MSVASYVIVVSLLPSTCSTFGVGNPSALSAPITFGCSSTSPPTSVPSTVTPVVSIIYFTFFSALLEFLNANSNVTGSPFIAINAKGSTFLFPPPTRPSKPPLLLSVDVFIPISLPSLVLFFSQVSPEGVVHPSLLI